MGGGRVCHLPKGFFFSKNGRGLGFSDTREDSLSGD